MTWLPSYLRGSLITNSEIDKDFLIKIWWDWPSGEDTDPTVSARNEPTLLHYNENFISLLEWS